MSKFDEYKILNIIQGPISSISSYPKTYSLMLVIEYTDMTLLLNRRAKYQIANALWINLNIIANALQINLSMILDQSGYTFRKVNISQSVVATNRTTVNGLVGRVVNLRQQPRPLVAHPDRFGTTGSGDGNTLSCKNHIKIT